MIIAVFFLNHCCHLRCTLPLSAPETFVNVFLSSVVTPCSYFLFIDNSLDFWFDSKKTFPKSFDYFAILSLRNDPFRKIHTLTSPSSRVDLPWTICGTVKVGNMAPFVNMFAKIFLQPAPKNICWATNWSREVKKAKHRPITCNETILRDKLKVFESRISPPLKGHYHDVAHARTWSGLYM